MNGGSGTDPRTRPASRLRKYLPLLILALGLAAFFATGAQRYVTFETLQRHRALLVEQVAAYPVLAALVFMAAYAVVVAFSLPGGALMTLVGGFLFGIVWGGSYVVVGATLGACIVFLAARTAFGDLLRAKAGPAIQKMEAGFREDAWSYLLILRLVPLFPFFLVNLVPAFLGVPLRTYMITTFIGIIPGTFVYASVGNGLGAILDAGETPDLGIIFAPAVLGPILGLAVLAALPVIYKRLARRRT